MKKTLILLVAITLSVLLFVPNTNYEAHAEANEVEPMGIYTNLTLNIGAENGEVYATVKNVLTIFPASVNVYIQLFSSLTYEQSYLDMTLEASAHSQDLNMGKSLRVAAPINNVRRYWRARMYYKVDNMSWKEKLTSIWMVDIDGTPTQM